MKFSEIANRLTGISTSLAVLNVQLELGGDPRHMNAEGCVSAFLRLGPYIPLHALA